MNQLLTQGIVLSRTDYGEADRIVTLLTAEQGKLRLMAKGVKKPKSKLAGGIELFSVSDITYITGKGDVGTLISSRLNKHYGNIIKDIERVQLGYELIKLTHKATEDHPEADYFHLLDEAFQALDDDTIDQTLVRLWFQAQLLKLAGHSPNLTTDTNHQKLTEKQTYNFDFDHVAFIAHPQGRFKSDQIKFLRLVFSDNKPRGLNKLQTLDQLLLSSQPLIQTMLQTYIRL